MPSREVQYHFCCDSNQAKLNMLLRNPASLIEMYRTVSKHGKINIIGREKQHVHAGQHCILEVGKQFTCSVQRAFCCICYISFTKYQVINLKSAQFYPSFSASVTCYGDTTSQENTQSFTTLLSAHSFKWLFQCLLKRTVCRTHCETLS